MTDKVKKDQNQQTEQMDEQNAEAMPTQNLYDEDESGEIGVAGGAASDQDSDYEEGDFETLGFMDEDSLETSNDSSTTKNKSNSDDDLM